MRAPARHRAATGTAPRGSLLLGQLQLFADLEVGPGNARVDRLQVGQRTAVPVSDLNPGVAGLYDVLAWPGHGGLPLGPLGGRPGCVGLLHVLGLLMDGRELVGDLRHGALRRGLEGLDVSRRLVARLRGRGDLSRDVVDPRDLVRLCGKGAVNLRKADGSVAADDKGNGTDDDAAHREHAVIFARNSVHIYRVKGSEETRNIQDAPSMEMTKPPTLSPRVVSTDCSCLITSAWNWEHAPLLQRDENWNQPLAFSQRAQGLPYNSAESPLRVTGFHGAAGGGGTGQ